MNKRFAVYGTYLNSEIEIMKVHVIVILLLASLNLFSGTLYSSEKMTVNQLFEILSSLSDQQEKRGATLTFEIAGVQMVCITADYVDRMRIVAPIVHTSKINEMIKDKMLESNYHSALDARYAISDHMVYAAFIHPLSSLNENEIISAVFQVASLKESFGDSYSSGVLSFGDQSKKAPI